MTEFQGFPKIARFNREVVVTEKIDGTSAAVVIESTPYSWFGYDHLDGYTALVESHPGRVTTVVYAQSRKRLITPDDDNFGFAGWVADNAASLVRDLGEGRHFGEWWGQGIQRKYGLDHKRFSLFNVSKYEHQEFETPNVYCVPVLNRVALADFSLGREMAALRDRGSVAAPGFDNPEGIVVFHTAGNHLYKATFEGDDASKWEL